MCTNTHRSIFIFVGFKSSLSQCLLQNTHLDFLPVYVHQPLPEVHPDRGLCLLGELPCAEAVGETGLPDARISDDDDFEDASPWRRKGQAAQRSREFSRRPAIRHITTAGWRREAKDWYSSSSLPEPERGQLLWQKTDMKQNKRLPSRRISATNIRPVSRA